MNTQWLRAGALGSFIAAGLLAVQFVIASGLGSDLILVETSADTLRISAFLRLQSSNMINLMVVDNLFVVAYVTTFLGFAGYVLTRSRLIAIVALGFALLTALFDLTENAWTIVLTRTAVFADVELNALQLLQMLAQLKWACIYVGVTLFAIAIWDDTRRARVVAILFLIFPVLGVMAPASVALAILRLLWMFVLLIGGGIFLWRAQSK